MVHATFPTDLGGPEPESPNCARQSSRWTSLAWLGSCAFLALLWFVVAPVPFLSEDWTQMEHLAGAPTLASALDPAREPLRPLQHAFLWALAHSGVDPTTWLPGAARAVAFLLHLVACLAVWGLARRARLGATGAAVALVLFAVFPNVKMLAWPAAIGSPGRTAFELVALYFLVRRVQAGRARDGWFGLLALAVALGFHETALLLPAILITWVGCIGADNLRAGVRRVLASLRDPFVLAACAIGAAHLVHLLFFRPDRVHGAKDPGALPANFVKAALSLAPEFVREIGVEGFRGHRGTFGFAAAGLVLALVAALAVWSLRRGGVARFAVLAVAIDLGLAVLGAGFVQRYACLASAFVALALAHGVVKAQGVSSRGTLAPRVVLVVGALWLFDAARDAFEIRTAGQAALRLATAALVIEDASPLAIVGVPDMIGAEEDVPFFNWGGVSFLRAHGLRGPVELLRERAFRTNSDQVLVDAARLRALRAAGVDVQRWSQVDASLTTYTP